MSEGLILCLQETDQGKGGCFCIGRQNGEPLCPCRMREMKKKLGEYLMDAYGKGKTKPVTNI